ncbi:MAG: hypothetical protein LBG59_06375 [Candidatus Peribacteria bacterium]|jgi:hypothetical protein|nr:hypothetical protein [Candidatus Peribacteria bacterium]
MRTIQHPNHQLIDMQVRQKFWETSKGKMENLKAIGNILQYVKGYLNQTTVEQQNF